MPLRCAWLVLRGHPVVYGCQVPGANQFTTNSAANVEVTWGNCHFD